MNPAKPLERFLRQHLLSERNEPCTRFVLRHVTRHTKSTQEVDEIFRPEKISDAIIDSLVAEVMALAAADAVALAGLQTYSLQAYYGKATKSSGRCNFRVDGYNEDDEMESSEPANKTGSLSQQMRHNEAILKIMMLGQQQQAALSARTIESLSSQCESMQQDRVKYFVAIEELLSSRHERELEERERQARQDNMERVAKGLESMVPVLKHKLLGAPVTADVAEGSLRDMVAKLVESLEPSDIEGLAGRFKPAQQILFMEVVNAVTDDGSH